MWVGEHDHVQGVGRREAEAEEQLTWGCPMVESSLVPLVDAEHYMMLVKFNVTLISYIVRTSAQSPSTFRKV